MIASLIITFSDIAGTFAEHPELYVTGVLPVIVGGVLIGGGVLIVGFGLLEIFSRVLSVIGHDAAKPAQE